MIKCEICGKEFKEYSRLAKHIRKHKLSVKEYYDRYFKKVGDGVCIECGKRTNFHKLSTGYLGFCSLKCANSSEITKKKIKQTFLKNYGVKNPMQSKEIKDRVKKTNMERYGVDYPLQSSEVRKKQKRTMVEKYGVEHPQQIKEVQERTKKTNIEKYGVENPAQLDKVKEKIKKTSIKKYGVSCNLSLDSNKKKVKKTNIERYGVENPFQSEEIKNKIKQENINKFGVENIRQKHMTNFNRWFDKKFILEKFLTDNKYVKTKEMISFFNVSNSAVYRHLKLLEIEYVKWAGTSHYESEIYEFLRFELGILNIIQNDRQLIKPQEVDFLLPDYKLAIEFNGTYWHSDEYKPEGYHENKTLSCKNQGVDLMHIWEDSWLENKEVFKRLLKDKLHKTSNHTP